MLSRRRGVQRAPGDDDPRRNSGMAHGPTLDSSGGVATAPTIPGPQPDPRRNSGMAHGPTLDSSGGVATAPTAPGPAGPAVSPTEAPVAAPAGKPLSGPPTMAGSEEEGDFPDAPPPRRGKHRANIKPAMPATRADAEAAYRANPNSVYRSKNESVHGQWWRIDPGTGGGPPPVYKSGNTYIIAHDLTGPGLPPPHAQPIEADEGAEGANVRAMGKHLDDQLRAKSSIPQTPTTPAKPAPGSAPPPQTPGMAYGPTLDNSGGVATAPTVPGPQPDPRRNSGMAHGPTLDSSGGVATAPTVPGPQPDPRRNSAWPTARRSTAPVGWRRRRLCRDRNPTRGAIQAWPTARRSTAPAAWRRHRLCPDRQAPQLDREAVRAPRPLHQVPARRQRPVAPHRCPVRPTSAARKRATVSMPQLSAPRAQPPAASSRAMPAPRADAEAAYRANPGSRLYSQQERVRARPVVAHRSRAPAARPPPRLRAGEHVQSFVPRT